MVSWNSETQVPVVVTPKVDRVSIYIPDLEMKVYGHDYIEAIANAVLKCTAVYLYSIEHNIPFELNMKYAEVESLCEEKGSFATFMCLSE